MFIVNVHEHNLTLNHKRIRFKVIHSKLSFLFISVSISVLFSPLSVNAGICSFPAFIDITGGVSALEIHRYLK